jgi:hypothetical protein
MKPRPSNQPKTSVKIQADLTIPLIVICLLIAKLLT